MTLAGILGRLNSNAEFKQFKKENPKTFLCSAFFVLDFESGADSQELNFLMPDKKIETFVVSDSGIQKKISKLFDEEKAEQFHELEIKNLKTDLDDIEEVVRKKLEKEQVSGKLNKILAILQPGDSGKGVLWNLTCILEGLTIIRIKIDAVSGKFLKFEKAGLMDFVKFDKGKK